ncbi:MAG: ABC transporter permease [Bacteroidetes bacterium]|nr:ABC transporter permease [Bacteroidota bacterium]
MNTIKFLLQKEFRQIFRNSTLLRSILLAPLIQLLVLPWAANYEVKNISFAVVDHDHSPYSQKLISKVSSSGYFKLVGYLNSYNEAYALIEQDKADVILEIPPHFERNLVRENQQKVFIAANAINGTKALMGSSYLNGIIAGFNNDVRAEWLLQSRYNAAPYIEVAPSNWFNPLMSYKVFMVPGILVLLVTMVGSMMCALNIVKEKEIGTIEQINVTPIRKVHFILGKLIPFWILGVIVFTLGMGIAWLVYGIVPQGSIFLLYGFLALYLLAVLGLGLLISTYSSTQQQAMSLSFFFIMIFNLMSGLFTPIESMPGWAQVIARLNPITYFIDVMRLVVLKGSGLHDIRYHMLIIFGFAVLLNTWAVLNYRKTS